MDIENGLRILTLNVGDKAIDCSNIIHWAENWDWSVGKVIAKRLRNNHFEDWETIVVLMIDEQYAGFCAIEKKDAWGTDLDELLTPFITAFYIDPVFRGNKLSGKLIKAACNLLLSLGFKVAYLISNQQGFYEKFGFEIFAQTLTLSGETEPVFRKYLSI